MRVTFALKYENITTHIFSKQKNIKDLQNAISQGKALLEPYQNPLSWSRAMDTKNMLQKSEQWKKNIEFGINWNNHTEGYLNSLNDLLTKAREIAIKAIKINSPEATASYVKELDGIIREAINIANSKYQDRYIFSAYSDPFSPLFSYSETNGEVTSIIPPPTPSDMNIPLEINLSDTTSARINIDGEALFFDAPSGDSIPKNLLDLKEAIKNGNVNLIGSAMEDIEKDQERVLEALTTVGANLNRLEARRYTLDAITISYQERLDELEETDMAKMATSYQLKITALQAVYSSAVLTSKLSLLDYL